MRNGEVPFEGLWLLPGLKAPVLSNTQHETSICLGRGGGGCPRAPISLKPKTPGTRVMVEFDEAHTLSSDPRRPPKALNPQKATPPQVQSYRTS